MNAMMLMMHKASEKTQMNLREDQKCNEENQLEEWWTSGTHGNHRGQTGPNPAHQD